MSKIRLDILVSNGHNDYFNILKLLGTYWLLVLYTSKYSLKIQSLEFN